MTNKINHSRFFFHALRTALMFLAGFLSYEILKTMENEWNNLHPDNKMMHFAKRKSYHCVTIFIADLILLYLIYLLFRVHL
jgi:hypothetical protein